MQDSCSQGWDAKVKGEGKELWAVRVGEVQTVVRESGAIKLVDAAAAGRPAEANIQEMLRIGSEIGSGSCVTHLSILGSGAPGWR